MEKVKQLKAALVGCGAIASVHISALIKCGVTVAALCDIDAQRAEKLKNEFNLDCAVYIDYGLMLSEIMPDAVHVCTPHYLHAPMIIEALNKNINVFAEKPLAISEDELKLIEAAAKKSKGRVGVCFQNRYLPVNVKAKQLAEVNMTKGAYFEVIWARDEAYYRNAEWRGIKKKSGGGVLMNQAIHTLDLLIWFLNDPEYISATAQNFHLRGKIDVEDTVNGFIEFKDSSAVFYATTAAVANNPIKLTLSGKHKIVVEGDRLFLDDTEIAAHSPKELPAKDYWGTGHQLIISDYYDALISGQKFKLDEVEGGRAVRAALKIYQSCGARLKAE